MFGLGFLAPAFLAALAAVAIPIALHLRRRRTDRVVDFPAAHMVPSTDVADDERRRLRDLLLLALRVAALVALAVSFARPYLTGDDAGAGATATIVAVDVSRSVSSPAAWAEVRRLARAAVSAAPAGDAVGLVAFDDRARVVAPPLLDRAQALSALDALEAGPGGTSAAAGLGAAFDALAGRHGRVVLVSDLQQRAWRSGDGVGVPPDVEVSIVPVTVAPGNLAVTGLTAVDGRGLRAVVQSYADGPRTVDVRLAIDGAERGRVRVETAPLSAVDVRFDTTLPRDGVAAVIVDDRDGAPADNARYLPLAPAPAPHVAVVTAAPPDSARTGLYVQRALEAGAETWPVRVTVQDGRDVSARPLVPPPSAVVLVGSRTLDRRGREQVAAYLRDGGRVFVALGPDVDVPTLADVLGVGVRLAPEPVAPSPDDDAIVVSDPRHPVWRQLAGARSALSRLPLDQFRRLLDESGWTVLARFAGGAVALAEREVGRGRLVVFTSDIDNRWNRFPLEPGFAPFVVDLARYLTSDRQTPSAFVLPDVPAGVPPSPGAHTVTEGGVARTIVVNVDPGEGDPAVLTPDAFQAYLRPGDDAPPRPLDERARAREEQQRWWQYGLALMLGLLVAEGLLGRGRRPAESG